MKIYACSSPQQFEMKRRYFDASLPSSLELVFKEFQVNDPSRQITYGTRIFNNLTKKKAEYILQAIDETEPGIFIYSDVDVQFFRPIEEDLKRQLGNKDICFQLDHPRGMLCAGFFICRANERTRRFWKRVLAESERYRDFNDQDVLNMLLRSPKRRVFEWLKKRVLGMFGVPVKWGILSEDYFTAGMKLEFGGNWEPGMTLDVPENIAMHHANWTVGVENKMALLQYVREIVESRKK